MIKFVNIKKGWHLVFVFWDTWKITKGSFEPISIRWNFMSKRTWKYKMIIIVIFGIGIGVGKTTKAKLSFSEPGRMSATGPG